MIHIKVGLKDSKKSDGATKAVLGALLTELNL
jgi:hypothetical protein